MLAPGVGPWVEVGQGESWQVQPQAPRGSRAAGGSGGVRRRSGSVLERGIGRMRLPRVRGSRACWLRLCPLSGVPVSGLPCCHCQGPGRGAGDKDGMAREGRPREGGGAVDGRPQNSRAGCPGMDAHGRGAQEGGSGGQSGGGNPAATAAEAGSAEQ